MKKKIILFFTIALVIFSTSYSQAAFTTGTGKHSFKLENFRVTPTARLNSFLIGFGINPQSSINLELSSMSDPEHPAEFLAPYFKDMEGPEGSFEDGNHFYADKGPFIKVSYQYIPRHELFVTPDALNAVEIGIKNVNGTSKESLDARTTENVERYYLTLGAISRSRWETHNLFSDINIIADVFNTSWGIDTELGYEYKLQDNLRFHLSYKFMGTGVDAVEGVAVGIKTSY
jgi:hypothetical protein